MKHSIWHKICSVLILLFLISFPAYAADYYVDGSLGNDTNSGVNPVSPWETIEKVNSAYFQPGDTIYFKCGETWREQLNVPSSGSTFNPVTFTSYGENCNDTNKPLISASEPISGWAPYFGHIYVADVALTRAPYNYIVNNGFDSSVGYWTFWSTNGDADLKHQTDCSQSGGCLKFTSGVASADNHFSSNKFFIESGKVYKLTFKVSADQAIQNFRFMVRKAASGWEPVGLDETIYIDTTWTELTYDFVATQTLDIARIDFYLPPGQASIFLDNVSIKSLTPEPDTVKQVFVDGQYLKLAQHPNSGYFIIDEDTVYDYEVCLLERNEINDASSLIDYDLDLSGLDVNGAGIYIRTTSWSIEDRTVETFDANTHKLTWTNENKQPFQDEADTFCAINKDEGYYLDNKLWMLDQPGEWYYDEGNEKLYVWLPDSSGPSNHLVEASHYDNGILVAMRGDVVLENLGIAQASVDGITLYNSPRFLLSNVDISDSGVNGIYVYNSSAGTIENCVVKNSVNQGIYVDGSFSVSALWNLVENTGTVGSPKNSLAAIYANSDYADITGNTVLNSGYNGIWFKKATLVQNNVVERSCLVLNDCGGIYTWNSTPTIPSNSSVIGNVVIDTFGNSDGTPSTMPNTKGIYLDDFTDLIYVADNTLVNTSYSGINLHNASNVTVENNTLYGNLNYQLTLKETGNYSSSGVMQNNFVKDNIIFPIGVHEHVGLWGDHNNIYLGDFDLNTYSTLYSDLIVIEEVRANPSINGYDTTLYTLSEWSQKGMDTGAKLFSPFNNSTYRVISVDSGNYINNGTFDTSIDSWGCWSPNDDEKCELEPGCNETGGCLKFTGGAASDHSLLHSNQFSVENGKTYVVEFNASADQSVIDLTATFMVRKAAGPYWESVGLNKVIDVENAWHNYQYVFTADQTLDNARLDIYMPQGQNILYLDDVIVSEVTVEFNDPADDSLILINKESVVQDIYCPDTAEPERCNQYIDLESNPVNWPVTLDPYSSKIIIWEDNPFIICTDDDDDGYAMDGTGCGLVDPDDTDPSVVPISDLYAYPHKNNRKIKLEWTCEASATGYNVYRAATSGGPYELIKSNHQTNACNYNDTKVNAGSAYYYVISFINALGAESPDSNECNCN
jgi:parallel beta-helix repeat protein